MIVSRQTEAMLSNLTLFPSCSILKWNVLKDGKACKMHFEIVVISTSLSVVCRFSKSFSIPTETYRVNTRQAFITLEPPLQSIFKSYLHSVVFESVILR